MKVYAQEKNYTLYNDNMLNMLENIEPNSIDAVITDPPYELGFMGKSWDNSGIAFQKETWQKCLEVLKPGGHLLAFGGSRTFHRIAVAIEDAGFEIRDVIMWLYGSGFPKSLNIGLAIDKKMGVESKVVSTGKSGKANTHTRTMNSISDNGNEAFGGEYEIKQAHNEWAGWGTALKPAYEPIIMARKPLDGTCVDNVLKWGVGGINIDECRVKYSENETDSRIGTEAVANTKCGFWSKDQNNGETQMYKDNGRYPANVVLTYDENDKNEVIGGFPDTNGDKRKSKPNYGGAQFGNGKDIITTCLYDDSGSAARYFYCAKASKKDRDEGLEKFEQYQVNDGRETPIDNAYQRGETLRKNTHPTVKPVELMQYCIRLVVPAQRERERIILDPFMGSGSTGKAVMYENKERKAIISDKEHPGYKFIGIELTDEYLPIAKARIQAVCDKPTQMRLF